MDPEERRKLDRAVTLAEDNNFMLKKLYRAMRWNRFLRIIYFVIIIGASVGLFYFIQPYIDQISEVYGNVRETVRSAAEILPGRGGQ